MKRFEHQVSTIEFCKDREHVFIASDPGTGKTCCIIDDYFLNQMQHGRMLVFAPLSILRPSWGEDIDKFQPELTWAIAHGKTRKAAFESHADVVIMNIDGVKWLVEGDKDSKNYLHLLEGFGVLVIDESTAYKHRTSQRSKAMRAVAKHFPVRRLMTGTPNPNSVQDLWHQMLILDDGKRLGTQFFRFRSQVCEPKQVGPRAEHVQWVDKPEAQDAVANAVSDVTVRYRFEDCLDVPENNMRYLYVDLPPAVRKAYDEFEFNSHIDTQDGSVTAVHAGAKVKKLLQLLSGCIYNEEGKAVKVHNERYELVIDLVEQRQASVVAFNWTHERNELVKLATKKKLNYGIIDGGTPVDMRTKIVEAFQAGKLRVIFAHPQSAGHGLTLTRGTATIWCSPTYNLEHFVQFNRRVYRAGQTKKTETIMIAARDTKEVEVYEKLQGKALRMDDILGLFQDLTKVEEYNRQTHPSQRRTA